MSADKIKKALLFIITLALMQISPASYSAAVETCIASEFTVKSVEGRVVFAAKDKRSPKDEFPLSKAVVELQISGEEGSETVAVVEADENGYFYFPNVRPGRYSLIARREGYSSNSAYLHVKKSSNIKRGEKYIVVALKMPFQGCGYSRLEKQKQ